MGAALLEFAERCGLVEKEKLTLVALSGGLDSICLCAALHEAGYTIAAAHFNHALRGEESDGDERFVVEFCAVRGIPCYTGRGDVAACARAEKIGTEEAGRKLRYDFLQRTAQEIGAAVIATAHHACDNAETMLFHLVRGTGSGGLAGIAPRRGNIVRPFLTLTRGELAEYAREKGLSCREDRTNADETYARNYIRANVLPELERLNAAAVRHMSEAALRLREDDALLNELAEEHLSALREENEEILLAGVELLRAPTALRRRMLRAMLRRLGVGEKDFAAAHYSSLEALCRDGQSRQLDLPHGVRAVWKEGTLRLFVRNAEAAASRELLLNETVFWGDYALTLSPEMAEGAIALDANALPLTVGAWEKKDRMVLPEFPAPRSLKRIFAERGFDANARESVPVIRSAGKIAAVCGVGVDKAFLPQGEAYYLIWKKNIKE